MNTVDLSSIAAVNNQTSVLFRLFAWGASSGAGTWRIDNVRIDGTVPTAIDLVSFTARPRKAAIVLRWETATEIDNLGFNLYRAESPEGERTRLNASLIPSQAPGSPVGAVYTWRDTSVQPGVTYYYWLEDVDLHGHATLHGPVSATMKPRQQPGPATNPAPGLVPERP